MEWLSPSFVLLGQAVDPLSGGAGWVGAGLLGLILFWLLMKHLPDQARERKELIASTDSVLDKQVRHHTEAMRERTVLYSESLREQQRVFKETIQLIAEQYDRQIKELAIAVNREFQEIRKSGN